LVLRVECQKNDFNIPTYYDYVALGFYNSICSVKFYCYIWSSAAFKHEFCIIIGRNNALYIFSSWLNS